MESFKSNKQKKQLISIKREKNEGCSLLGMKKEQVQKGKRSYSDVLNANERELKNTNIILVVPDTDEGERLWQRFIIYHMIFRKN